MNAWNWAALGIRLGIMFVGGVIYFKGLFEQEYKRKEFIKEFWKNEGSFGASEESED